jgi:hypothetical protein
MICWITSAYQVYALEVKVGDCSGGFFCVRIRQRHMYFLQRVGSRKVRFDILLLHLYFGGELLASLLDAYDESRSCSFADVSLGCAQPDWDRDLLKK